MNLEEFANDFVENYETYFVKYVKYITKYLEDSKENGTSFGVFRPTDCLHTSEVFRWHITTKLDCKGTGRCEWETDDMFYMGYRDDAERINKKTTLPRICQITCSDDYEGDGITEDEYCCIMYDCKEHMYTVLDNRIVIESWLNKYRPRVRMIKEGETWHSLYNYMWYHIEADEEINKKMTSHNC